MQSKTIEIFVYDETVIRMAYEASIIDNGCYILLVAWTWWWGNIATFSTM